MISPKNAQNSAQTIFYIRISNNSKYLYCNVFLAQQHRYPQNHDLKIKSISIFFFTITYQWQDAKIDYFLHTYPIKVGKIRNPKILHYQIQYIKKLVIQQAGSGAAHFMRMRIRIRSIGASCLLSQRFKCNLELFQKKKFKRNHIFCSNRSRISIQDARKGIKNSIINLK